MLKLCTTPTTRVVAQTTATYNDYNNRWDANMSNIYDALIRAAATYCDRYQSDILLDINNIKAKLESGFSECATIWFGFRDCGVDGKTFMEGRLSEPGCYGTNPYRRIMALVFGIPDYDGTMEIALLDNVKPKIEN